MRSPPSCLPPTWPLRTSHGSRSRRSRRASAAGCSSRPGIWRKSGRAWRASATCDGESPTAGPPICTRAPMFRRELATVASEDPRYRACRGRGEPLGGSYGSPVRPPVLPAARFSHDSGGRVPAPVTSFSIRFLGCKVSQTDAHEIRERLLADGHTEAAHADVAVVNTCCVTHEAVRKSRHAVARAARSHRRVFASGCAANLAADAFAGLPDNVTVVARRSEETPAFVAGDVGALGCLQADARLDRVRAFVKIQDGCSFACNFCVIPLVRGASRSRSAEAVLSEVRRRIGQGHREVVLTGINLGCYRDRAAGYTLARLVRESGEMPGLARLRLSSIEVNHVRADVVAALRETPTVSRHLHVPLQSGSDVVLRDMARRYSSSTYLKRLEPLADF